MIYLITSGTRRIAILALLASLLLTAASPHPTGAAGTGPTHRITWDAHSVLIDGKRVLLYSGELHYWRLPSQSEWQDRLEKMKAAGLNAVSIYFDWQYHSNAPGQYDFTGIRDVNHLLDITDRLGLYVLARVGPYMNAEADAGGLPGWLLTKQLFPRAQTWDGTTPQAAYSPLYSQYSREWFDHIIPILARHQVTNGGSVLMVQVENEYNQDVGSLQYMQDLISYAKADGITVPIFHNDFYFKGDWSKVVDLYGYDSYPYGFSCCHQWGDLHFHGIDTWESVLRGKLGITTPMFVSELQGGSFDPWGGQGYDKVGALFDGDWLTAIDHSALAQGTTILNTYMFAGGTSWGYMSEPQVYTSYDYGAPISEAGELRPAYYAAHRLGLFLQSYGPSLANADAAQPTSVTSSNANVAVHTRIDAGTGQLYMFIRHGDPGDAVRTTLTLASGGNTVTIPQQPNTALTVPGHGAALLTANVDVGPLHMNYSTSSVLSDCNTAQGHYLVLYGPEGSQGETDFVLPAAPLSIDHNYGLQTVRGAHDIRLNYKHTAEPRTFAIHAGADVVHLLVTSTDSASRYWCTHHMVVSGADLVTDDGNGMRLSASSYEDVRVFGAPPDRPLVIDGRTAAAPDPAFGETLLGHIAGPSDLALPKLDLWRYAAEAPEAAVGFDDSQWQAADHTSTPNPNVPQGPSLLADDYGFHYGFVWYRGHFTSSGAETAIAISARHSYSVFLNGVYLGGGDAPLGDPPHRYANLKPYPFPAKLLHPGADNVVAVLTESLGHDEGWIAGPAAQSPQGILSALLINAPTPIAWKIQGAAGGEDPANKERGLLNASGLFGERAGWYLPQFDDSHWATAIVPDKWRKRGVSAAIGWYRTHFALRSQSGAAAPLGITIPHASDKAIIWLNGWLVGRYWEQRGPQHTFWLPDGILHRNGDNVLAVAVWNRGHAGGLTAMPVLHRYTSLLGHSLSLGPASAPPSLGYLHTSGSRIVDAAGRPARIAAVNWFGAEDRYFVPSGLEKQPLAAIVARVHELGFNTIRLPFSNQLVEQNPIVADHVDANPDLKGLHALDVMDRIIAAARADGLRVILDDQRSDAGTQPQRDGLWYSPHYPESSWIRDWQTLAQRYKDDPTVVGVDLRNEPHTGPPGPWTVHAYLNQGATWGPYKGKDSPGTDWRLAAERGGNAVLAVNPKLLIFVEGLQLYPDTSQPDGVDSYWWGGVLQPARKYPVELSVPHQLVYSPHEYGPLKWQMAWFGPKMTYKSMVSVWTKHWAYLERPGNLQAPIFLGEFGTCGTTPKCVLDRTPGSQGLWFSLLLQFLKEHSEVGWGFWALNGTNFKGDRTPEYVLKDDWHSVSLPALVNNLRDIELPSAP